MPAVFMLDGSIICQVVSYDNAINSAAF